MKVFTAILFLGTFLVLIGMPENILAQRRSTTPRPPPGPHEEYWPCGSWCENTCDDRHAEERPCRRMCKAGNFCAEGYIREHAGGPCILPSDCPVRH